MIFIEGARRDSHSTTIKGEDWVRSLLLLGLLDGLLGSGLLGLGGLLGGGLLGDLLGGFLGGGLLGSSSTCTG